MSEPNELVWEEMPSLATPVYKIDERPNSLTACFFYGWQHTLVDISPLVLPMIVGTAIGMTLTQQAQFVNFSLFAMGLATLLQTTIGNRLPIIQGPSATLTGTIKSVGKNFSAEAVWGGIFLGGLLEMLIGATKLMKFLKKLLPIAVSGIVIVCIGLSLGKVAMSWIFSFDPKKGESLIRNLSLALAVVSIIFVLQIYCSNLWNGLLSRGAIFIAIVLVGIVVSGILGYVNWQIIAEKPWFSPPQFLPYGFFGSGWTIVPIAILGIVAGYLGSMVESLGDYATTCAISGEEYTTEHMNKGIFSEGLGCVVASLFGGMPCTSYSQNVGVIATTGIASRFIVQIAAIILILYGLCPKFGAILVAMPRAVLGSVFVVVCGTIVFSGTRLLALAENTKSNSLLIGITLISAITIPSVIDTESLVGINPFVQLLMTNTVVIAVVLGIVLNVILNILPKKK